MDESKQRMELHIKIYLLHAPDVKTAMQCQHAAVIHTAYITAAFNVSCN
jgi:hypothetical protein